NLLNLPARRYPETLLLTPLGEHVLLAKADLIAVEPQSRFIIADWKSGKPVPSQQLATHIQTRVYRYVAVLAGSVYNDGEPVHPEQVEMIYWFAQAPEKSVRLPYSVQQFNDDHQFFLNLIHDIQQEQTFPTVLEDEKERVCRFCVYRNRCWQEVKAGELADDQDFSLDLELSWGGEDPNADAGGFIQALESEF
ncbi:MAG: PD-(D/E)XK nuclease family protein, partial [Phototrophicaceae bacterium]